MASPPSKYNFTHSVDVENKIVDYKPRQLKRTRRPVKNKQAITRHSKSQNSTKRKLKPDDFKNVCRICLLPEDNMISMISKNGSDCVADMFHSITSVEVNLEENLPLALCGPCHSKLIDCYSFKIKCLESNNILQSKVGNNENRRSNKDSSIVGKEDKAIQTCVDDYDVNTKKDKAVGKKAFRLKFEGDSESEADYDDYDNNEDIEFLEEDSYLEESKNAITEIEKQIQQITSNFLKEIKDPECLERQKENQFSCSKCSKTFRKLKALRAHAKVCSGTIKSEFACSQCPEGFDSAYDLKIHSAIHVKGSKLKCVECDKEFTERTRFRRHIRCHMASTRRWACDSCGKAFAESNALRRHLRVHTGEVKEKNFQCKLCHKKFADKNQLREHNAKHTGERPWTCEVCEKTFPSPRLLASHRRVHSDNKAHACVYCDKRFRMKATLTTHHRTHTGERPYTCSTCGKSFIQASNLNLHMRVHTGEKPYSCDVCGRGFASGSRLAVHARVHTGEKPYSCPTCGKRFARTDIKAHMRLHTGERPYVCTACSKRFVSNAALREHNVVHTGEKRFECTLCPGKYKKKMYLKNHIDKVHGRGQNVLMKVQPYKINVDCEMIECEGENQNVTLDADEIPLDDGGELVLLDGTDVKAEEEQNDIKNDQKICASLNEVVVGDYLNISEEGEMNESDSNHDHVMNHRESSVQRNAVTRHL
ncbi:zinc finger protein 675-like isoform X1 [Maniola hyperantus]|uniref:zinc finger protein 675-like isoform X1 n=1 Tax=Aphantopus hyperantus TaxID=2795564 RepID=UPI00156809AF|nr:zinc finger protein 260-like isoform X2 [Maniola hyperantus]